MTDKDDKKKPDYREDVGFPSHGYKALPPDEAGMSFEINLHPGIDDKLILGNRMSDVVGIIPTQDQSGEITYMKQIKSRSELPPSKYKLNQILLEDLPDGKLHTNPDDVLPNDGDVIIDSDGNAYLFVGLIPKAAPDSESPEEGPKEISVNFTAFEGISPTITPLNGTHLKRKLVPVEFQENGKVVKFTSVQRVDSVSARELANEIINRLNGNDKNRTIVIEEMASDDPWDTLSEHPDAAGGEEAFLDKPPFIQGSCFYNPPTLMKGNSKRELVTKNGYTYPKPKKRR